MKVDILDAHDRNEYLVKQDYDIGACCQDLINKRPFGDIPFYIFAHARTLEMDEKFKLFSSGRYQTLAEVPTKTLIWQPRLTKPKAQTNSMLFKGYPGTDLIKVIWILPPREMWDAYKEGNVAESETVLVSIYNFENSRAELEAKEEDDLDDATIDRIYREISKEARFKPLT